MGLRLGNREHNVVESVKSVEARGVWSQTKRAIDSRCPDTYLPTYLLIYHLVGRHLGRLVGERQHNWKA